MSGMSWQKIHKTANDIKPHLDARIEICCTSSTALARVDPDVSQPHNITMSHLSCCAA